MKLEHVAHDIRTCRRIRHDPLACITCIFQQDQSPSDWARSLVRLAIGKLCGNVRCVVISGGVSSINDIKKAKGLNNNKIEGIIVGKAIYDGDIKLDELAKEISA